MTMADLMAANSSQFQPLKKGDMVSGVVKKLTPKEILLDIKGKSDALVIEYDKKNMENLLRLLKVGDTVKASVISAESEEGFPVVSLRRMLDDLIYEQLDKSNTGDGEVMVQITDQGRGGYFAQTTSGIRGFLPNSQVLEEKDLNGKTIPVKIIELNKQARRVIFSQKALHYVTALDQMKKYVKEGEKVKGVISNTSPYGIYVDLIFSKESPHPSPLPQVGEGINGDVKIEGFIHISEISHQRVESVGDNHKKGETVEAFVLGVDGENRRVNLSLKKLEKDAFEGIEAALPKGTKVKATVVDSKTRGVTVQLENGVQGFIASSKISSGTEYKAGQVIEVEVSDYDSRKRLVVVSPVLKEIPMGYR